MLTENQVVDFVVAWLERHDHKIEVKHKDTAKGDDIKAVSSAGEEIFVECKGAVSKSGNQISEWKSASMALFGAILDTEYKRPAKHHGIAIPDTPPFHEMFDGLKDFLGRQKITVFWVSESGALLIWRSPNWALPGQS